MNQTNKSKGQKFVGRKSSSGVRRGAEKKTQRKARQGAGVAGNGKPAVRQTSKLAEVIAMLRRPKGASIEDLCKATGWQAHSVRGAISGAIKKKLGLTITSTKTDGKRVYRMTN